jgi:hypothetical protein
MLRPTEAVLDVWSKGMFVSDAPDDLRLISPSAEKGEVRADLLWLPDLCASVPVVKQVVKRGQTV